MLMSNSARFKLDSPLLKAVMIAYHFHLGSIITGETVDEALFD